MPLRSRRFVFFCIVLVLAIGLCPARADDVAAVGEKLNQAKKEYDGELRKFRKGVTDLLDKREEAARNTGDRKLVDQIKAERKAFEQSSEIPPRFPATPLDEIRLARTKLDKAYTATVKDYLRLKDDKAAAATEEEQSKFQFSAALAFGRRMHLVTLKHYPLKDERNWFTNNGTQAGTGTKLKQNGELVPHSIFMHPPNKGAVQVHYPLAGRWTALRVTVGVPKIEVKAEPPASPLTFEVRGDGNSLWKSEPVTKLDTYQPCELNVAKVKILTLIVYCANANEWARSTWFEPIIME